MASVLDPHNIYHVGTIDRNSIYTPKQTPFTDLGLGSLLRGSPVGQYPIDPRLDAPRRPLTLGNIWQDLMSPAGKPTKKAKKIESAAVRAAKAQTSLETELETSEIGRMMKLAATDERYARARDLALAGQNTMVGSGRRPLVVPPPFVGADTQGAQMPPPPGYSLPGAPLDTLLGQTALSGANMGRPLVDPTEQGAARLANQDDARLALRGAPAPGMAGITALMGGNTGLPVAPVNAAQSMPEAQAVTPAYTTDMFGNVVPLTDASGAQVQPRQHMGGTYMPVPTLPQAPVTGPFQEAELFVGAGRPRPMPFMGKYQSFDPKAMSGDYSVPEDFFVAEPGHDPDATSNQLYRYIAQRDQAGGMSALGRDLNRAGNKAQDWLDHAIEKSGEKLEHYFTPKGPGGRTPAGEDLIAGGDKVQEFMDYMGTVPVPAALNPWNWDFGGGDKKAEPPVTDPAILFPEEELPPEEGGGGTKDDGGGDLDKVLEKYLTETDTSYDDAIKTINQAYGGVNVAQTNPKQDAADAYAAREGERTAALAQLAMAGGLLSAAGGTWARGASGFTDAAKVYGQGFDRYHKALIDSADRFDERQRGDRAFEIAKRDAALQMWKSDQTDKRVVLRELMAEGRLEEKDKRAAAREDRKNNLAYIDDYFKSILKTSLPEGDVTLDAEQRDAIIREIHALWRASRRAGKVLSKEDLAAAQARAAAKAAVIEVDTSD